MIVFHSDLDNTIIYSYKREIGENKKCVEIYQEREISFITEETGSLLEDVKQKVLFVPTTTRTTEQYNRINLGIGEIPYALVCNGGILLVNGKEDEQWYRKSLELTENCRQELHRAEILMEKDANRSFEVRNIRELFVFTKSEKPLESVEYLKATMDTSLVEVFYTGVKVYVVPRKLSKGMAIQRFRERIKAECTVAAGDSEFDLSMIGAADVTIVPQSLYPKEKENESVVVMGEEKLFAESVLKYVLETTFE